MALTDLIPFAEQVRDETQAGANTAIRVGQLFVDIITQAAQQDQTLAQALAALPALPFDSARFYTTDNQGQDQWTGDQAIEFLCNGVVVATLPIKVAAQAYSGLMSAADKAKLDAMPAIVVSGDDAIGSLIASASQNSMDITPYAVDGTIKTPISLPVVQRTQNGAVSAGVVPAALQNSVDIYGQGLVLDINGRTTASVILVGCRVCRGSQLLIESMDNVTCDGTIDVGVSESNIPWLSGERMGLTSEQPSVSFDVSNGLANLQLSGNYMTINAFQITLTSAQNVRLRVRVTGVDSAGGVAVLTFSQSANYVQIYGKDSNGQTITFVNLPAASTTKAGVLSAADKQKLNSVEEGAQPNVQADWSESDNTSPAYILNKPTIGTAAALNVPTLGNASSSEVVKGNDTRLTDARPASDVYPWAKAENPPVVTKADVGLGNCDNTSDMNKPVSIAQQAALNGKQNVLSLVTSSAAATLDATDGTYYVLTTTIGTFTITLPTMSDTAKVHTIGIYFETGATPAVTISSSNLIKYDENWEIVPNKIHEINALWNGVAWVLTLIRS
jgi:hypothetical protein